MTKNLQIIRLGILGSGQLARMLFQASQQMSIQAFKLKVKVFTDSADSPVAKAGADVVQGSFKDKAALHGFLSNCDVVVFENEFLDTAVLKEAVQGLNTRFVPSIDVIYQLQNKQFQKEFLVQRDLPTAPFIACELNDDFEMLLPAFLEKFGGHCVLKWTRLGYDGKGVFVANDTEESKKEALNFFKQAQSLGVSIYIEQKVPFKRELAMIGVYSANHDFTTYPLVVSEQENGICRKVLGPAMEFGVAPDLELKAQGILKKIAEPMGLFGAFGVEFFETESGELLVNEIAPRVHNSGHYTINACATSQFENHLRAAIEVPLGKLKLNAPYFGMLNLIGQNAPEFLKHTSTANPGYFLNWYEKDQLRPGRKVGHINLLAQSKKELLENMKKLEEVL